MPTSTGAATALAVLLAVTGCESAEPPSEEHVFEGQVKAIDKAREVETILSREREQQP
jgi:hypothetical protein